MKQILIFAGTTEGRTLAERLAEAGIYHTVCVATEYGEIVLKENPFLTILKGRKTKEEMRALIQSDEFEAVIDATHPYADVVTANIRQALEGLPVPYFRLKRDTEKEKAEGKIRYFQNHEACEKALGEMRGNILLTTGSKDLFRYCQRQSVKERLFVRVLPGMESLSLCMEEGIQGKRIIAMQGPFTEEMNLAVIRQFQIACLVTKRSGQTGGYPQKLSAASKAGIPVFVIGHPEEDGISLRELCRVLEKKMEIPIRGRARMQIMVAGIGMGNRGTLTKEVEESIQTADILLGAERMIAPYTPRLEKKACYRAEEIRQYLKEKQETLLEKTKVVILCSGDSGFYSGATILYRVLDRAVQEGSLEATIRVLPGISSISYLAACVGESYHDARILSMHGKQIFHLGRKIRENKKTYLLMSGVKDVQRLGNVLCEEGLHDCEVILGYQMSYPEQEICHLSPMLCKEREKEGLYTCLVKNPYVRLGKVTHGVPDEEFLRERVPMTKEEVREVMISKLRLREYAVVYDIGSGTGSIGIEIAGISDTIFVYAIEKNPEAVRLTTANKEKFGADNLEVMEGEAPEILKALPVPTHAFIGGSSGNLESILEELYRKNPSMRIVISAITWETICEMKNVLKNYPVKEENVVQIQVSRAKKAGDYHLMRAENPVWICAFEFCEESR